MKNSTQTNSKIIIVNNVELNIIEAGDGDIKGRQGKLVILLHGFPSYSGSWFRQIDVLHDAGYRVVAPDLRGFNRSEKPQSDNDIDFEKAADDIAELVKYYEEEKVVIIGHDFGGIVGWMFAMKYPNLLEKFVAVTAPTPFYLSTILNIKNIFTHSYFFLFQIKGFDRVLARLAKRFITRVFKNDPVNKGAYSREEIKEQVEAFTQKDVPLNCMRYYRSIPLMKEQIKPYGQVKHPILILTGDQDQYVTSSKMADPGREVAPNAKLIRIDNCSHWPMADQAMKLNTLLLEFLR